MIYLRSDYGSTWKGTVTIKDTIMNNAKPSSTTNAKSWVVSIYGLAWSNHDFGYTCHMPNTVIDNLQFANASYKGFLSSTTYYPKVYVVQKANNSTSTGRFLDNNATVGEVTYTAYWYNMWHRTDIGKEILDSETTLRDGTVTTTNYNVYVAPDYITVKNNSYTNINYYVPNIDFFKNTTLTGVSTINP